MTTNNPDPAGRYDAAVANLRETAKWLVGSIGAVFVTLLAGIQFNDVPFATDEAARIAGVVAVISLMITFALAIATLVGGSVSFDELSTKGRFKYARRFIKRTWDPAQPDTFARLVRQLTKKRDLIAQGKISSEDARYQRLHQLSLVMAAIARWRVVRWRFGLLVTAMMLLIPIELFAAAIMFARSEGRESGTTLTVELKSDD